MKGFNKIEGPGGYPQFHKEKPEPKSEFDVVDRYPDGRIKKMIRKGVVLNEVTEKAIEEVGPKTSEQWAGLKKALKGLTAAAAIGSGLALWANEDFDRVDKNTKKVSSPTPYTEPYQTKESKQVSDFDMEVDKYQGMIDPSDIELTKHLAEKPVIGAENYTREEYVEEKIEFRDNVPEIIQEELRRLMPALAATESRFDASRVSSAEAKGILQFTPKVWEEYGGEPGEEILLRKQVEIAGEYISDLYEQIQGYVGEEKLDLLRSLAGSEDSFQKDIMVPLIINSYNAGAKRMSEAVIAYLENTPVDSIPEGKDIYSAIVDYAEISEEGLLKEFGDQSSQYTKKVYALAEELNNNRG